MVGSGKRFPGWIDAENRSARVGDVRLTEREARERFVGARVARLATVGTESGRPHLVPMTFAVTGDLVVHAIDHKPKSTIDLRRLRNIAANKSVCALVDEYADDWTKLWWARADGPAEIREQAPEFIDLLAAKYPQYQEMRPSGPVVVVKVERWSGWSAA
jgi:PPOX class probable F420-dependent enzyme